MSVPRTLLSVLGSISATLLLISGAGVARGQCYELAKLTADDASNGDYLGWSVAIDGDTAVVGAQMGDGAVEDSGAAYVFEAAGGDWVQTAKLVADDGQWADLFGTSVSLAGDMTVVGAPYATAAYVFVRSAGAWQQEARLVPESGDADDFARAVALGDELVVIGAPKADDWGYDSGAAYLYKRHAPGDWHQSAREAPVDSGNDDHFGYAIAVTGDVPGSYGDVAVIGAFGDDDSGSSAGAVYVFRLWDNYFERLAKLHGEGVTANDNFGWSVAISGDLIVVGAPYTDNGGKAYVFRGDIGGWVQEGELVASDAVVGDLFGSSVATDGESVVVGNHYDDDACSPGNPNCNSGSAYVFRRIGGQWTEVTKLAGSGVEAGAGFGRCAAMDVGVALVGAPWEDNVEGNAGAAYVFGIAGCDCPADIDGDGLIGFSDLAEVLAAYGACDGDPGYNPAADLNNDGCVGFADLAQVLAHYGWTCP